MATKRKAVEGGTKPKEALRLSREEERARILELVTRLARGKEKRTFSWQGRVTSVQPRIRLTRSFDQSSHTYLGYALRIDGTIGDDKREFWVGIGGAAHAKHRLEIGVLASGECQFVSDPRLETVEYYKVARLKIEESTGSPEPSSSPPWRGVPPELPLYRERGHRRLAPQTYTASCSSCKWGCNMAVEMIIDQWNPTNRRYRTETFCYGPKSCSLYKAGPKRVVPGRKGMRWVEEDWVDEEATSHRED